MLFKAKQLLLILTYRLYQDKQKLQIYTNMDPDALFKVEDINSIIRLFAFSIQDRFEEIDGIIKSNNYDTNSSYLNNQCADDSDLLLRKYRNYMATDSREIKYLEKLVVRISQILEFFKQRAKNQQIVGIAIKKIQQKLNKIANTVPIDVQWLYSCILDLAKNGFVMRRHSFKDRRYSLKKMDASADKKTVKENNQSKPQTESDQFKLIKPIRSTADPSKKRRPYSLNANRTAAKIVCSKQSVGIQLSKIYDILQIDNLYIQKMVQSKDKERLEKQLLKQNCTISTAIQSYDKNYSIYYSKKKQRSDTTLKQVNNRASLRPVINNWISRKRKLTQCKKKRTDSENITLT